MTAYRAKVLSCGATRRSSFDGSPSVPLVQVVLEMPCDEAERMARDFEPDSRFSPAADDARSIARPVVEALVAAGLGGDGGLGLPVP